MSHDPARTEQLGRALIEYLTARLGASLAYAQPPEPLGRALDTQVYALRLDGAGLDPDWTSPLVLRVFAGRAQASRAAREAAVQRFVAERNLPVPRLLAAETDDNPIGRPFLLMRRAPGVPLSRRLVQGGFARVLRLAGALAQAHVRLHVLALEGCPLPYEGPSVDRQLERFRAWAGRLAGLEGPLAWLERHREIVSVEQPSLCHNDVQPFNIIADEHDHVALIDWSNAELGDRHQDVADALVSLRTAPYPFRRQSAFGRAAFRVRSALFERRYLARYAEQLHVDAARLRYWEALRALGRWAVLTALSSPEAAALGMSARVTVPEVQRRRLYRYVERRTRG